MIYYTDRYQTYNYKYVFNIPNSYFPFKECSPIQYSYQYCP